MKSGSSDLFGRQKERAESLCFANPDAFYLQEVAFGREKRRLDLPVCRFMSSALHMLTVKTHRS